jgi:hypothetical protein
MVGFAAAYVGRLLHKKEAVQKRREGVGMEAEVPGTELLTRWTSAFFYDLPFTIPGLLFLRQLSQIRPFGGSHHNLLVELGSNIKQIED